MTPIEIMALIVVIVSVIKILTLLIKPIAWMEVVKFVYSKPLATIIVSLILGYLSLTYLLKTMTIVQIFSVILFMMFLMALSMSVYSKDMIALGRKLLRDKNVVKKAWLALIVWIVLILWVLKELFM